MAAARVFKVAGLLLLGGILVVAAALVIAQDDEEMHERIDNAMSAAPLNIAENATIIDWDEEAEGGIVVLREGTNGWVCYTDLPTTPGNDPQCNDAVWESWTAAFMAGEDPEITQLGISYMLAGGSDASNTDPFATEPAEGEDWMTSPPHIMLLLPDGMDLSLFTTDHMSGDPWVMWAGTPYEHIMVPVDITEHTHE